MDCLVLPIQSKLEDWKKVTMALDKEHARGMYVYSIVFIGWCFIYLFFIEPNHVLKVKHFKSG